MRVETNEAFAAVPLPVAQELGLPEDIINVEGGTIARGHPIGTTGAVLTTRLIHAVRRDGPSAASPRCAPTAVKASHLRSRRSRSWLA
jgi:acetyl-CoA acetyltransferase